MARRIVALEFAEMAGEPDLLLVGQVLAGEYENGVPIHPGLDRRDLGRGQRRPGIDAGDFGREPWMQLSKCGKRAMGGPFRRTLAETDASVRRTITETQPTICETDAQWMAGGARRP